MTNYKKDAEMEKEMDAVDMGNFVKYDEHGHSTFRRCPYCYGPLMGHIQSKCPKVRYDKDAVEQFEIYLENLGGFSACCKKGYSKYIDEVRPPGGERDQRVTEIRKQRPVPEWRGGDFELWRKEIVEWNRTHNSREEDKYQDVLENLKKNGSIREFVINTLIRKVGETKTVDRILEIMSEKYERNVGEKIMGVMKKICGEGFKMDGDIEKVLDHFEQMMVDIDEVQLEQNLKFAMGLQFVDKLEKGRKIDHVESMQLRDLLEDADGNPRANQGVRLEAVKKRLRKIRNTEGKNDPFKTDVDTKYVDTEETYFVRNGGENRSRRDN